MRCTQAVQWPAAVSSTRHMHTSFDSLQLMQPGGVQGSTCSALWLTCCLGHRPPAGRCGLLPGMLACGLMLPV